MHDQALEKLDCATVGEVQYLTIILDPKDVFHLYTFAQGKLDVWQKGLLEFWSIESNIDIFLYNLGKWLFLNWDFNYTPIFVC